MATATALKTEGKTKITKIPYAPTTDYGLGILPVLVRAINHAMFVIGANFHEWPMTVEQAQLELSESKNHLRGLADIKEILSADSVTYINLWTESLQTLSNALAKENATDPDKTIAGLRTQIKQFSDDTFGLLAKLDEDLCGLASNQTDPGKLT